MSSSVKEHQDTATVAEAASLRAADTFVKSTTAPPWALWRRQIGAIISHELRKNLFSRRSFLMYLLAALPLLLLLPLAIFPPDAREWQRFDELGIIYAALYGALILRTVVFFGCAWIFMNLFRGEIIDRSLHYYFLAPVRREVLVVAKYLSGLLTAFALFGGTTLISFALLYLPRFYTETVRYFFLGRGAGVVFTYLGITLLACVGYGAVFMLVGLFFRNPIVPALALYGWEWLNFLLPPLLKKLSVIHYLQSLAPVPMYEGPFAILAQPTPAWISVPSLLLFTVAVLLLAGWYARRMEVSYVGD